MKFLLLGFVLLLNSAWAQSWEDERVVSVVQVLSTEEITLDHVVSEDTFVPNLNGYACPWPGIKEEFVFKFLTGLRHGRHDFDRDSLRVKFNMPNEFCAGDWPTGEEVFGPEYVAGAVFKLTYKITRDVVNFKDFDDSIVPYLREVVSTTLLGRELRSVAHVKLAPTHH